MYVNCCRIAFCGAKLSIVFHSAKLFRPKIPLLPHFSVNELFYQYLTIIAAVVTIQSRWG